jgi:hypothetical protein
MGRYSHFTFLTTLHKAYHMVTRVSCDQAFVRYASPIFSPLRTPLLSLSRLLNDGLRLHELLTPPFGSYACHPDSNHRI